MLMLRGRMLGLTAVTVACLTQCRSKENAAVPAPMPAATATADPTVVPTEIPAAEPTPTPTPALPGPRPLGELVVPTAIPLSLTPTPTPEGLLPLEDRLAQDEKRLASLGAIVRDADALDGQFRDYVASCFKKYMEPDWRAPSSFEATDRRQWFTLLDAQPAVSFKNMTFYGPPTSLVRDVERCEDLWSEIIKAAPVVMQRIDALPEEARRAGVLPGNLRALLKKHRLVR